MYKQITNFVIISILALLVFAGQISAGPNSNATLSLDLIPNGEAGNRIDNGITSGNVSGRGTKIAVEVFAKGVTTSLVGVKIEFDFDASVLKVDKVENSAFAFVIPETAGANFASATPVTLPSSGFLARAEFSTAVDVTGREFSIGIKQVTLAESASLRDEITTRDVIRFNATLSPDFDGDGVVGFADFVQFAGVFGSSRGDGTYQAKYDLDSNGAIGFPDFLIFTNDFGKSVSPPTESGEETGDDHSNTRSGATRLRWGSIGDTLTVVNFVDLGYIEAGKSGRIETSTDVDYFSVQVNEYGVLIVYTTGNFDTQGALQNSSGSTLTTNDDDGSGNNFEINYVVNSGTYYIKVEGYGSDTGSYTLYTIFFPDDSNTRSGATRLPLDDSRRRWIETGSDVDYFTVQVNQPGILFVYTTGYLDTVGSLESNPDGGIVVWASDDDSGEEKNFLIIQPIYHPSNVLEAVIGTYYIKVSGFSTGSYTLNTFFQRDHSDTRSGATSLPLGGTRVGQIKAGDVDYFRMEVSRPGVLHVGTDIPAIYPVITGGVLEDSSGSPLVVDEGYSLTRAYFQIAQPVGPGTYYIQVHCSTRVGFCGRGIYQIFAYLE